MAVFMPPSAEVSVICKSPPIDSRFPSALSALDDGFAETDDSYIANAAFARIKSPVTDRSFANEFRSIVRLRENPLTPVY